MNLAINAKIEKTDTCWNWQGIISNGKHPRYCTTRTGKKINIQVRRYIYQTIIGEIPENTFLNMKCGNSKCVNPEHARVGTMVEKVRNGKAPRRRKEQCASITHCPQGHAYAGYNLIEGITHKKIKLRDGTIERRPYPSRWCRTCLNTRNQEYRHSRKK